MTPERYQNIRNKQRSKWANRKKLGPGMGQSLFSQFRAEHGLALMSLGMGLVRRVASPSCQRELRSLQPQTLVNSSRSMKEQ
ncbi:hypothetical protein AMTR_s00087p00023100 [Amborella trichopoda]|uniref:Uncharacterized protein n=1 Tax=Amborella trichopoda TaxID=13333 RepID=W1P4P4_AMBTC|nr:hypothetical protein AMTR_s00087p00023100 [Amborella trichopoda]